MDFGRTVAALQPFGQAASSSPTVRLQFAIITKTGAPELQFCEVRATKVKSSARKGSCRGLAGHRGWKLLSQSIAAQLPDLPVSATVPGVDRIRSSLVNLMVDSPVHHYIN